MEIVKSCYIIGNRAINAYLAFTDGFSVPPLHASRMLVELMAFRCFFTAHDHQYSYDWGSPMSVTTPTKDASATVRSTYAQAQDDLQQRPVRAQNVRTPVQNVTGSVFSIVPPLVLALLLLISWYIGTTAGHVSSLFLPTPSDVLARLVDGLGAGMYLRDALVVTLQESFLGFLLAVVIALPLGYGIAKSRFLAITIQPYLSAGQAVPALVIAPFLILWLGYGLVPIMVICMLVVLFPMVINTILGVQTIDSALTDAARVEGASGWSLLAHIEFPLALPSLLAAVRTGLTLSITGAVVGEFVSGGAAGLGSLVLQGQHQYDTPLMFAAVIVLAVLAALYYGVTWLLVKLTEIIY